MARLHLGVDYGTSASKLVLRYYDAPGGERAYLLEHNDQFRFFSAISFENQNVVFNSGLENPNAFKSLKMRFAEDITGEVGEHFYGESAPIPFGLTAEDLVTLTVWRLISIGHLEGHRILNGGDFTMGMTLGIPMSFLDREILRNAFLRTARTAYEIYKQVGPIGVNSIDSGLAKQILANGRTAIDNMAPFQVGSIRNWIRSETEASMLWSFFSPAIPSGPYFCVDVGAGTTDANAFLIKADRIGEAWIKIGLVFFGAHSVPYAMDAIGTLDSEKLKEGYAAIRDGMVKAGQKAYAQIRDNRVTVEQWRDPKMILLGGGSLDASLCSKLLPHPMHNWRDQVLDRIELSVPSDLVRTDGSSVRNQDIVFTSVAYGLAQIGDAAPEAALPNEVQPVEPHRNGGVNGSRPDHSLMYDD